MKRRDFLKAVPSVAALPLAARTIVASVGGCPATACAGDVAMMNWGGAKWDRGPITYFVSLTMAEVE